MFGLVKFMIKDDIKFNQLFQRILSIYAAQRKPRLLNQNKRHLISICMFLMNLTNSSNTHRCQNPHIEPYYAHILCLNKDFFSFLCKDCILSELRITKAVNGKIR